MSAICVKSFSAFFDILMGAFKPIHHAWMILNVSFAAPSKMFQCVKIKAAAGGISSLKNSFSLEYFEP